MNYYLKTSNEQELWGALEEAGLAVRVYDDQENYTLKVIGADLDIIGTIHKQTGNMITDDEGFPMAEMVAIDGFHANLKCDREVVGLPTVEAPATPFRTWSGE